MRIVECPSPNHDPRAEGAAPSILVLHYTGMRTAEEALARLCDPEAKVSAHYTIDRDGRIYRHVSEDRRARHAGVSYWAGIRDVNSHSIGIELVNPGHEFGYLPFSDAQIGALIDLSEDIFSRHPSITPSRVVGHSDVAPNRKIDPGELFPWKSLSEYGIGVWPFSRPFVGEVAPPGRRAARPEDKLRAGGGMPVAEMLSGFGYGVPPDVDWPLNDVISAFQRRFRTEKIDGIADGETVARLSALVTACG